jgi:hypothetical protein
MSDYISRDEAIESVAGLVSTMSVCVSKDECIGMQSMKIRSVGALRDVPAADVAPVVHGKWIPVTNGRGGSECNMCHAYAPSYQSGAEYNSPYCPECGAKMDGGDHNAAD